MVIEKLLNVSSIMSRELKFPDPEKFFRESKPATISIASLRTFCLPLNCKGGGKGKGFKHAQWIQVAFAPTWDGATPVYHAATTLLKTDHGKTPFAKGGFAWWRVTRPNWTPMFWLMGLPAAALDWPVWYLSKEQFLSEVVLVTANPQAYDEGLASKLWSLSADVGLSE